MDDTAHFSMGGREIGPGKPCLMIGEVAQTHDGSLGTAHAFIDAIALAGADAVKFQTHIASAESTPAEPWRVLFSQQDDTRYDYWKRMEFTEEQWKGLALHGQGPRGDPLSSRARLLSGENESPIPLGPALTQVGELRLLF